MALVAPMASGEVSYDAENWTSYSMDCDYGSYWIVCELTGYLPEGACKDGTLSGSCSESKPLHCSEGVLSDDCDLCGCPAGKLCSRDGSCQEPPQLPPSQPEAYCEEIWVCTDWSGCMGGTRFRGCVVNECVKDADVPHTSEACEMPAVPEPVPEPQETETVPEPVAEEPEAIAANITEAANETFEAEPVQINVSEAANETGPVNETDTIIVEEAEELPEAAGAEVNGTADENAAIGSENATSELTGTAEGAKEGHPTLTMDVEAEELAEEPSVTGMAIGAGAQFLVTVFALIIIISGVFYFMNRPKI
jgi:hypothetical protein